MHAVILTDLAGGHGGAERVAVESALALAEAGVRITFIHAVEGADARLAHPLIERICLDLTDVWQLPMASALQAGLWNRQEAARLAPLLQPLAGATDTVLHVHQWTRAFSPAIFPVLGRSRLPVFVTAHDYFLGCPNGVLFRFDRGEPCSLTPMSAQCLATNCDTKSYLHKCVRSLRVGIARGSLRHSSIDLVHVSDVGRAKLAPLVPDTWRHHRVDNPVAITKEPSVAIDQTKKFAFIGRLTREKGALLAASAAARAKAPTIFIGDGPAADDIRAICPKAEMTGWIPADDVLRLLRQSVRAVLAPSLWPETGPLTVYEAAANGLASIVSNRCGASEKVTARSGLVVDPTPQAFAEAMLKLKDDDLAATMGAAAADLYWANPPTPAAHAQKLIALYQEACRSATSVVSATSSAGALEAAPGEIMLR
jgi:glycosyltransferase involved in cell wall biosynthesis